MLQIKVIQCLCQWEGCLMDTMCCGIDRRLLIESVGVRDVSVLRSQSLSLKKRVMLDEERGTLFWYFLWFHTASHVQIYRYSAGKILSIFYIQSRYILITISLNIFVKRPIEAGALVEALAKVQGDQIIPNVYIVASCHALNRALCSYHIL